MQKADKHRTINDPQRSFQLVTASSCSQSWGNTLQRTKQSLFFLNVISKIKEKEKNKNLDKKHNVTYLPQSEDLAPPDT